MKTLVLKTWDPTRLGFLNHRVVLLNTRAVQSTISMCYEPSYNCTVLGVQEVFSTQIFKSIPCLHAHDADTLPDLTARSMGYQ
jgi:hypothetical protein